MTSLTSKITDSYAAHYLARLEFLTSFQWIAAVVGTAYVVSFFAIGSTVSAIGTSVFMIGLALSFWWRRTGNAFLASSWLAITFLMEPTTAITVSGGIDSPYLVWLIVPIFAAGGLLGARGALIAAVSAVVTFIVLWALDDTIDGIDELSAGAHDVMFFLSFASAVGMTGVLAWIAVSSIERDSTAAREYAIDVARRVEELAATEARLREEIAARDRLDAIVSHDLRTPAATLKMLLDEHGNPTVGGANRDSFESLLEHMLGVMEDVRLVDQPDLLRDVPATPARLCSLIRTAADVARSSTRESGAEIEVRTDRCDDLELLVPRPLVRQIAIGVITNRSWHADVSRLTIDVETRRRGNFVDATITFTDDGQADTTGPADPDQTVLGLDLCRAYACEVLAGDLTLHPAPSGTTTFVLTARFAAADGTGGAVAPTHDGEPSDGRLDGLRVLLVEDSATIRLLTRRLLERSGATVIEAADGIEGLRAATQAPVDAVITDLHMPRMDGDDMIRAMRRSDVRVPVIGVTAATGSDLDRITDAGAEAVFDKPVDLEQVATRLRSLVAA